jgi:integrase
MRGHLRQRGKSWELRAYVGVDPITKRPKYLTRTLRCGKREAEEALARFVTEVSGGGHGAQDTTVGDLIREWFALAAPELSPTTVKGYDWIIKTYIFPALELVPLGKLRAAQLDRFYATLRNKGGQEGKPLSAATVRQVHAILRRALRQGLRWGWISTNPAALASPPRVTRTEIEPPDPAGVVKLIETATKDNPEFGCFLNLAATTGARRGELCGLHWDVVDLKGRSLVISRSVVEAAHSVIVEKETKTRSVRRVALDQNTTDLLTEHWKRCQRRAQRSGKTLSPAAYVFSGDVEGRRPWVPNDVTKDFIRLRNKVGLKEVRLHDLRHFSATRLLAAGVPVRTVSGRLGHANASTTLGVYAHFVQDSDREAADALGAVLTNAKKESPEPRATKIQRERPSD